MVFPIVGCLDPSLLLKRKWFHLRVWCISMSRYLMASAGLMFDVIEEWTLTDYFCQVGE